MAQNIRHDHARFYIENESGHTIAELTYVLTENDAMDITHTFVDPSLRGQGTARQLLDAAAQFARDTNRSIIPTCPYIEAQFNKDESLHDLRA